MVDGNQAYLVDVVDLFHRLTEAQAEIPSARAELRTVHLDPFIRIGVVFCRGRNPVANDRSANHVGDEFVLRSVPGKQRGAGASPAVQLGDVERAFCAHFRFILRNTGWPQDPHQVGVLSASQAGKKLLRALAEIAGSSGDLELLPHAIGKNFHLGADGRFVVGNPFHRDEQRVIPIAALIVQQHRVSARLGDDQIRGAIAIHVSGNQGARFYQLDLVQLHPRRHVLKACRAHIAQRAQLRPMLRLDRRNQVEPAIVVDVDGG